MEMLSRKWTYFLQCCYSRSMKVAAEKMAVTQSAMSVAISNLEKELNFKLFTRSSQGLDLTDQGAALFEKLRSEQRVLDRIVMESTQDAKDRLLTIGCIPQFVERYLLKFLNTEHDLVPRFQLYSGFSYVTLENIIRKNFDFGFIVWENKPVGVKSIHISKEPLGIIGRKDRFPNLANAHKKSDLKDYPIVRLSKIQRDAYMHFEPNQKSFVVQDYYAFRTLILEGQAIGDCQLDFFTDKELAKMVKAPYQGEEGPADVYLIYHNDRSEELEDLAKRIATRLKQKFSLK